MTSFTSFSDTYTSAFPALHSIPIPPSISTTSKNPNGLGTPTSHSSRPFYQQQQPLVPPRYPKYLKLTTYADLVHEQYEHVKRQRRQTHHGKQQHQSTSNQFSSSTESEHDIQQQTFLEYDDYLLNYDLRLPSAWNCKDKARHIEVDNQGLELKYAGPGKTEAHAASIRSNFPMRPQTGLFYYEVEIISKGDDGYIGIGFCTKENDLERLPGWDVDSFGYHGDDGHGFAGSGVGDSFGPSFTTGDIIGCGVNFSDGSAFYTKNGTYIGTAFTSIDLEKVYYPVVGLRTPGEHVVANFGEEAFLFDVELYIREKATVFWKDVLRSEKKRSDTVSPMHLENDSATLVLEHLLHHGYSATAKALVQDHQHYTGNSLDHIGSAKSVKDTKQRQDIRHAIMEGHIDEAIRLTDLHYPGALHQEEQDILFDLQCGRFVEIMRDYTIHRKRQRQRQGSNGCMESNLYYDTETIEDDPHSPHSHVPAIHTTHSPSLYFSPSQHSHHQQQPQNRRTSWASIAAGSRSSNSSTHSNCSDYFFPVGSDHSHSQHQQHQQHQKVAVSTSNCHAMEPEVTRSTSTSSLSDSSGATTPIASATPKSPTGLLFSLLTPSSTTSDVSSTPSDDDDEDNLNSSDALGVSILKSAMILGQHLQDEYRSDKRPFIKERLTEIFSLLAYPNVETSPSAPLLDLACRDSLATKLNSAILESQSKSTTSSLERNYQQAVMVNKYLAYEGNGKAVLLKINSLDTMNHPSPL